jgi:hypothetical protein
MPVLCYLPTRGCCCRACAHASTAVFPALQKISLHKARVACKVVFRAWRAYRARCIVAAMCRSGDGVVQVTRPTRMTFTRPLCCCHAQTGSSSPERSRGVHTAGVQKPRHRGACQGNLVWSRCVWRERCLVANPQRAARAVLEKRRVAQAVAARVEAIFQKAEATQSRCRTSMLRAVVLSASRSQPSGAQRTSLWLCRIRCVLCQASRSRGCCLHSEMVPRRAAVPPDDSAVPAGVHAKDCTGPARMAPCCIHAGDATSVLHAEVRGSR